MIRRFLIAALLLAGAATSFAQKAPDAVAINLTGKWQMQLEMSVGTSTPVLVFKQDGEKLSGHYAGSYGEAPLTGAIKGTAIEFALDMNAQGNIVHIVYSGVVEKDTVKGTVRLGDLGDGTFTGKRK